MRQAGIIPDEAAAGRLVAYLKTQGISARVDKDSGGWQIWVRDEDQLEEARQALAEFKQSPEDARFLQAEQQARQIHKKEAREDAQRRKNVVDVRRRWDRQTTPAATPVTFVLMAISVLVTGVASFQPLDGPVANLLRIAPITVYGDTYGWERLAQIRGGEVWRLITPIFVHAQITRGTGILHILFNMYMLAALGGLFEACRGFLRMILFVLLVAAVSNLAQYWAKGPLFGGMSGVLYGIFGYAWMKTRYDRRSDIHLDQNTIIILLVWYVLCLVELIPNVANWSHTAGLVAGVVLGYAPVAWRRLRGSRG